MSHLCETPIKELAGLVARAISECPEGAKCLKTLIEIQSQIDALENHSLWNMSAAIEELKKNHAALVHHYDN